MSPAWSLGRLIRSHFPPDFRVWLCSDPGRSSSCCINTPSSRPSPTPLFFPLLLPCLEHRLYPLGTCPSPAELSFIHLSSCGICRAHVPCAAACHPSQSARELCGRLLLCSKASAVPGQASFYEILWCFPKPGARRNLFPCPASCPYTYFT